MCDSISAERFLYYDGEGEEKEAKGSMIDDYLKAVECFKDIIDVKIKDYNKKYDYSDTDSNGCLEITD